MNGNKIKAIFDTGASTSVVSLEGAKSAGITPTSEGVVPAGVGYGIGQHYVRNWIAPFHSFKIGDEEIREIKLHIGDIGNFSMGDEMLLGADFFLSHRIYVANSRDKLYFTYNGGPVFSFGTAQRRHSQRMSPSSLPPARVSRTPRNRRTPRHSADVPRHPQLTPELRKRYCRPQPGL